MNSTCPRQLANATTYGLAAYVQAKDRDAARALARRMRTGNVPIAYPAPDLGVPFGGDKQSGDGREYGGYGPEDFLELKAIIGWDAA